MAFPVKWFSSTMQGAPALSVGSQFTTHTYSAGALISMLKAVLVTGFGNMSIASLSFNNVTNTITATVSAEHKYLVDSVVAISGANESGFNGEFRVISVTSNTVTFALDNGTPSSSSATGTLIIGYPSLGWSIEYEDAPNYKIIFKRSDLTATPLRLRIDNSAWSGWDQNNGQLAKVAMIENPTDINTYTTVYEHRWPCTCNQANAEWQFVGDSKLFYFIPRYANANRRSVFAFGDINTIRPGDNYHCLFTYYVDFTVTGGFTYDWNYGNTQWQGMYTNFPVMSDSNHKTIARSYHQLVGTVAVSWRAWSGALGEGLAFPNPADNGFYVATDQLPVMDDLSLRGYLPGIYMPYASSSNYDCVNLKNLPNIPNKIVRLIGVNRHCMGVSNGDAGYRLAGFDITGPWR